MSRMSRTGLVLNAAIILGWLGSLVSLLGLNIGLLPWWLLMPAVLGRTLLQTGLFIIGHDAMHRILCPARSRWNDRLGAAALALYAALPYQRCRINHQRHHQLPATAADPDFPSDDQAGALHWYRQFMAGYLSLPQMGCLLSGWAGLGLAYSAITPTAIANVLLFCMLPLLLSSLQLFIFGTYLPHRGQRAPHRQSHPESLDLPAWLSLLACFHFGYHREHHDDPGLSWFELPAARARSRRLTLT
jgi:beta-carotene ketolase (CrtW type)